MAKQLGEVISSKTTVDNVTVYLHTDGKVSSRRVIYYGKLDTKTMFKTWAEVCIMTEDELIKLLRSK